MINAQDTVPDEVTPVPEETPAVPPAPIIVPPNTDPGRTAPPVGPIAA